VQGLCEKWADLPSIQGGDDSEDSDDRPDEELEPKLEHVSFSEPSASVGRREQSRYLESGTVRSLTLLRNSSCRGREGSKD
jgi:hypothetical protein